jgi:murein DD-endopeptidase MepM/ murein hydrolase activator NlpD
MSTYWDSRNKALVETIQTQNGLVVDGLAGEETFSSVDLRSWPLKDLNDGREIFITNPYNFPDHKGIDVFWHHQAGDPLVDGYWTKYGSGKVWYPEGTRAVAAAEGSVIHAAMIGTGFLVLVQHLGGYKTGYFHGVDGQTFVSKGDQVKRGQDLFVCGWDLRWPLSEGNPVHLHFSAQLDGAYMDPAKWLRYASYLSSCP